LNREHVRSSELSHSWAGDVQQLQVDRIEDLWQEQKVVCGGCWKSQDDKFKPLDKQIKIKYEEELKDYQATFKAYEAECKTAAAASKGQAKGKKTTLKPPTKPKDLKPVARPSLPLASTVSRELVADVDGVPTLLLASTPGVTAKFDIPKTVTVPWSIPVGEEQLHERWEYSVSAIALWQGGHYVALIPTDNEQRDFFVFDCIGKGNRGCGQHYLHKHASALLRKAKGQTWFLTRQKQSTQAKGDSDVEQEEGGDDEEE
jgi:hypothetical protein